MPRVISQRITVLRSRVFANVMNRQQVTAAFNLISMEGGGSMTSVKAVLLFPVLVAAGFFLFHTRDVSSQSFNTARDPGVRGGPAGAGGPIGGLNGNQQGVFVTGKADFLEVEEVVDGLGPRMNLDRTLKELWRIQPEEPSHQ
jgi:hypothetical protein